MEGHVLALYGATVSLVTPIGGLTLAMITELSSVWISVAVSGALLLLVAVAFRVLRPAALVATDPPRHHGAVLHHASHFGQFVGGFVHPGQFSVSLPQGSSGTTRMATNGSMVAAVSTSNSSAPTGRRAFAHVRTPP